MKKAIPFIILCFSLLTCKKEEKAVIRTCFFNKTGVNLRAIAYGTEPKTVFPLAVGNASSLCENNLPSFYSSWEAGYGPYDASLGTDLPFAKFSGSIPIAEGISEVVITEANMTYDFRTAWAGDYEFTIDRYEINGSDTISKTTSIMNGQIEKGTPLNQIAIKIGDQFNEIGEFPNTIYHFSPVGYHWSGSGNFGIQGKSVSIWSDSLIFADHFLRKTISGKKL